MVQVNELLEGPTTPSLPFDDSRENPEGDTSLADSSDPI